MKLKILFIAILMTLYAVPAYATDNTWNFSLGLSEGSTFNGETFTRLDVLVEAPPSDTPKWFSISGTEFLHSYINTPKGNEINISKIKYPLGGDNLSGAGIMDGDNFAFGLTYENIDTHWNVDWLKGITLTAAVEEGQSYIAGLDLFKVITPGWFIESHVLLYLNQDLTHYKTRGHLELGHNFDPEGLTQLAIGHAIYSPESWTYIMFRAKTK